MRRIELLYLCLCLQLNGYIYALAFMVMVHLKSVKTYYYDQIGRKTNNDVKRFNLTRI